MKVDSNKFLIMAGPNVIESEEHTMLMASKLKKFLKNFQKFNMFLKLVLIKQIEHHLILIVVWEWKKV